MQKMKSRVTFDHSGDICREKMILSPFSCRLRMKYILTDFLLHERGVWMEGTKNR